MSLTMILNKENVETMWKIRKLVRREFGFELKISDQNAVEKLKDCENQTGNSELKDLIQIITLQLKAFTSTPVPSESVGTAPTQNGANTIRYYRGQRLETTPRNAQQTDQNGERSAGTAKHKRVYRGRIVSD